MNYLFRRALLLIILLTGCKFLHAQKAEVIYLSGTGSDHTVDWQFYCSAGKNAGKWTTIPVPSCWELQGFGKYDYGHVKDAERGREEGLYKYTFQVPGDWKKKEVSIVFEGAMTDAEVKINGKLAGAVHQGAFYSFRYDISRLLNYGSSNLLEVRVAKQSTNASVNKAERHGDYWLFGGIFRPVYLEAKPLQNIQRVAVSALADGSFQADVYINARQADKVQAQIVTLDNQPVGSPFSVNIKKGAVVVHVQTKLNDIKTWTPESPNLYQVKVGLYSKEALLYETATRFGFRTIEVRERDGIYVNGVKIKFKGVCRHTFRPSTGRASCKQYSLEDVKLMKDMNMNAVRMSHYPPDAHFLDVCDSLGLFVLDELAGWHGYYDTGVGSRLVKEFVEHDVNHPSVVMWDNGNEGGHNLELDSLFGKYDIQKRMVIHPWQEFNGMTTQHYRSYDYGAGTYWHGHQIVFPTEFLHGLYDGGSGAGLYDYWEMMWNNPLSAGGFLWVFADEGVIRTDDNNRIDTYGASAPDGILGPFHEKEGSYFAIKEVWSPVRFEAKDITAAFDGALNVENRYFYTNLNECSFTWKLAKMPLPGDGAGKKEITGTAAAPSLAPGHKGQLKLALPLDWHLYDVLYVTVKDRYQQELYTSSWPISLPKDVAAKMVHGKAGSKAVTVTEADTLLIVKAGNVEFTIGKKNGLLKKVVNTRGEIPFTNGPVLCAGKVIFNSMKTEMSGDTLRLVCSYDEKSSRMKQLIWTFYPSGLAKLDLYYVPEEYDVDFDYMGVSFSYPENLVQSVTWLGNGPYRVWKNRLQGVELDLHNKAYNNTITGVSPIVYPEFKGYHSNLYWATINSKEQSFTVATSSEDVFLRLYTPAQPEKTYERVIPPFPGGDISFLQAIPAIGNKTSDAKDTGPAGKKNMFFDYGPYDNWHTRCKIMTLFLNFSGNQ